MNETMTLDTVRTLVALDDQGKYDATIHLGRMAMDPQLGSFTFNTDTSKFPQRFSERNVDAVVGNFYGATDTGWGQLCRACGVPDARWMRKNPTGLQSQIFDHWINQNPRPIFFRFRNNTIRAALTDQYVPVNNSRGLTALNRALPKVVGSEIRSYSLDDHRFYLKVLFPALTRDIVRVDGRKEQMKVGVMFTNSEVGASSIKVEPFIYRLACTNDLIVQQELRWTHQHRWIAEDKLNDMVEVAVARGMKDGADAIDDFERLDAQRVKEPEKVLKELLKSGKFADKYADLAVQAYRNEPADTRFGVINALTAMGRTQPDDTRVEVERFAGQLLRARHWAGDNN